MAEIEPISNATFWLALIGAFAWIPQIISWIYSIFTKPKLRFVPDKITEIGYNINGPMLNHTFAISTTKKDALIERIKLTIIHETGEQHEFYWKFLYEGGTEIISDSGGRQEVVKNQSAIALKISTVGLIEKKIGFQDISYLDKLRSCINAAAEKRVYFERTNSQTSKIETTKAKEFLDLLDFIEKGFYWKEGKYNVHLYAYETSLKTPHIEHFKFELTSEDVARLKKNIKETQDELKDRVLYTGKDFNECPKHFWDWVYPSFDRTNESNRNSGDAILNY